jgi:hypothetical protein
MIITDPKMSVKMARALKHGGDLFTLDDIEKGLATGAMQGHVEGDTWAITRVHDWPRKRSVDVICVVGDIQGALVLEERICEWAKGIGAEMITATGRDGWWGYHTPGWQKTGTLYSKDIKS